jgi:lipopolysaccharide/colanic/teichoic acid biosynthesis glycosyltransferase
VRGDIAKDLAAEGAAAPRRVPVERFADVFIAGALLVITLPLLIMVALAIKYESRGTVFDRQARVGSGGRRYALLKFRTTEVQAVAYPPTVFCRPASYTRIGQFLHYSRIDDLPQLINVLRGDMSLTGARSERPSFLN